MDSKALTDAEIDRLLAMERKATPGEWTADDQEFSDDGDYNEPSVWAEGDGSAANPRRHVAMVRIGLRESEYNGHFIAGTRNSIRSLAEEVKRSRARIEAAPHDVGCPHRTWNRAMRATPESPCNCWKSESNPATITAPRVADTKGRA